MSNINQAYDIQSIIDSICNLKNDNLFQLSEQVDEKIKIFVDILPKVKKPYDFNIEKLLLFLKQHIKNLSNEALKIKNNCQTFISNVEKKYEEQSKFLLEKMLKIKNEIELYHKIYKEKEESEEKKDKDIELLKRENENLKINYETQKLKIIGLEESDENKDKEIKRLNNEIDNLKDEKEKIKKEIINLEIYKGRNEIENENLKVKYKQLEQLYNKLKQKKEEFEEDNKKEYEEKLNVENEIKSLKDKLDDMSQDLIGIKNRDNYKSIIYIFLINNGIKFEEIGGKVYYLIRKGLKNEKIKTLLTKAYNYYDNSRNLAHQGYNQNIMEKLFPKSEFSKIINDKLITDMKELINEYEDLMFLSEKEKETKKKNVDENISKMTNIILNLNL